MDYSIVAPRCFADWLDVTFPPDLAPFDDVRDLLTEAGGSPSLLPSGVVDYRFSAASVWGNVQLSTRDSEWSRVSASGNVCKHLRDVGLFDHYLSALGSSPHRITRLDATLDLPVDGADVIAYFRSRLSVDPRISLTRKALTPTWMLSPRASDGRETGTMFLGRRSSARVSARVYDKAAEVLANRREVIPALTRFEVTCRADMGVTLRDAHDPTPLFFHFASPGLLSRPPGVPDWSPGDPDSWRSVRAVKTPYERLSSRVEYSSELDALADLADSCGPGGRLTLLRLIRSRLGLDVSLPDALAS